MLLVRWKGNSSRCMNWQQGRVLANRNMLSVFPCRVGIRSLFVSIVQHTTSATSFCYFANHLTHVCTSYFEATCNSLHELGIAPSLYDDSLRLLSSAGSWRDAWRFKDYVAPSNGKQILDNVVIKTIKWVSHVVLCYFVAFTFPTNLDGPQS